MSEDRRRITIAVLGDVGSGKRTLIWRLLTELGSPTRRLVENCTKGDTNPSGAFDTLKVEKAHSSITEPTIQLESPNHIIDLIDTPNTFGAREGTSVLTTEINCAILVVGAGSIQRDFNNTFDKGGQTRELVQLAYARGITHLIVAINKMDTAGYSAERFDDLAKEICSLLIDIGYDPRTIPVIPISSAGRGDNLRESSTNTPWYTGWVMEDIATGQTIIDAIDAIRATN